MVGSPRVMPMSTTESLGAGRERGLAFGGGGEWFIAWLLGYATAARERGVDLGRSDISVGTSAGSIVGAYITSDRLWRNRKKWDLLAEHPRLAEHLAVIPQPTPSQQRCADLLAGVQSTDPATIREIGRAAMASHNGDFSRYVTSVSVLLGHMEWPSEAHHVTAVDCYSGERVVVSHDSGIPIATACAASSSLPGFRGPGWLGDHYCMDGGVSSSSTHADLLIGVRRAIVFSLTSGDHPTHGSSFGMAVRVDPGSLMREARALDASGTRTLVITADPPADTNFLDPRELKRAIALGTERAHKDLPRLLAVWND